MAGQALTGMPRGTNDPEASRRQQYDGLIEKLLKLRAKNVEIVVRCETVLEKIKDQKSRTICRYYYVEGESDYTISQIMEIDRTTVWEKRNAALNYLGGGLKTTASNAVKG